MLRLGQARGQADLRKMPIRPTKNAHLTYKKGPSDLLNMSKRQLKVGQMHQYAVFNMCPSDLQMHQIYNSCYNHVLVGWLGSKGDGRRSKNTPSYTLYISAVETLL